MSVLHKHGVLSILVCLGLFASACGAPRSAQYDISTAVAQTIQAGDSLTKIASLPTATAEITIEPSLTPSIPPTSAPTLVAAPSDPGCAKATLVAENPPDKTILKPGANFWKTWTLLNTGTCAWDSSYHLIFWSGDLMDGLTSYPLPNQVLPGQQKDVSIYLKTPVQEGTYTGYWRIQTPWNTNFGVGPSSDSFFVQVVVSSADRPAYGITSVSYNLVRNPPTGCPTNVRFNVYATITTNGPYEFDYFWDQSDGNASAVKTMKFKEAGSNTVSREWMIGRGDSPNPRWMNFVVTSPDPQEYDKVVILNTCP